MSGSDPLGLLDLLGGRRPDLRRADRPFLLRQVCWAHLRRDFQAMIDRVGGGQEVGAKLLALSGRVFDWWRRLGSGAIRRSTLRAYVGWLRPVVRLNLEAGRDGPCQWTAKVCRQILLIEGSLRTFARVEGVGPDNNAAERALRHGVIWRLLVRIWATPFRGRSTKGSGLTR